MKKQSFKDENKIYGKYSFKVINIHALKGSVKTVPLNGWRFDCGSVGGFVLASYYKYQKRLVG